MEQQKMIPHLFRTEFRKIVSVLTKRFGAEDIGSAEDIASETFLQAMETWPYRGVPENPTAWLYTVARNKARNHLQRAKVFQEKVIPGITSLSATAIPEIDLSEENISDSQLQMLFALCHPSIPVESQIALSLRMLCGFGIDEIANAFLTNKETINKRLFRAKEKLRSEHIAIEMPPEKEVSVRLEAVLRTLYLLFSEGYYSESQDTVLREDLCLEAMRLTWLLADNQRTNSPAVNALLALMCFHASRFPARKNDRGELILYHEQDEKLWDQQLIAKGVYYLNRAASGDKLSKYHLEGAIAYWQTVKTDTNYKWEKILWLYDQLLNVEYSPVAALNRIFAVSKVRGNKQAIADAEKLDMADNHYYWMLLGELHLHDNSIAAKVHFRRALDLAQSKTEKDLISRKLQGLTR